MLLVLVGGVMTANATIRIYFTPNKDYAKDNASFKMNQHKQNTDNWNAIPFVALEGYTNVYYADMDNVNYDEFQVLRYNPTGDTQWGSLRDFLTPTESTYYIMTQENYTDWQYYTCEASSYLPEKYYFMSNIDGDWKAISIMTQSNSAYSYEFNASSYTTKHFACASGAAFRADGSVMNGTGGLVINAWSNLIIRPTVANGGDINFDTFFSNYSGSTTTVDNDKVWYVASENNESKITFSYTPSTNSFSITCKKSASINATARYATYSNSEPYIVSGAEVFVVTAKGNSSVHLDKLEEGTVLAANAGVILKGSGSVDILSANANPTTYSGTNYLVGSGNSSLNVTAGEGIYVFSWDGDNASSVGFYLASENGTLGAHKAYLDISTTSAPYLSFDFGDDTTSINEIGTMKNDGVIYSLSGVRLNKLQKGVNIVNGKKVVVK